MNCTKLHLRYHSTNQRFLSLNHNSKVTKVDEALQLFDEMLQRQPPPSIFQFNQLINVIVKMRHYSTALSLYKQIKLMGIPADLYAMNVTINCLCRLNQVPYGFAFLATIFKQGHPPNSTTYNILINGHVLADRVFEAVELFKKLLRDKLCEPNQITFGTVINGLCKVGHTSKALELLMFLEASSCKPCVEQYSTVIDSLCKDKMVDDALQLFANMTEKGVLADVITYNSLIQGLCNFGREKEAAKMLRDMEEEGVSPSVVTFTILVNAFCKQGSVKDAELAVQAMLRKGLEPNVVTYSALIDGYCLRGEIGEAKKVLDGMVERDIVPNIITYNSLINGYCKKKRINEALNLFRKIQNKGLIPDVITYNSMLQGLFQSRNPAAARELFKEMQTKGQTPNLCTYRILFHGMCNNFECCDALDLFRSLGSKELMNDITLFHYFFIGAAPNSRCKTRFSFAKYHSEANKWSKKEANKWSAWLEKKEEKGVPTSWKQARVEQYSIVIDSLCKDKMRSEEAQSIFNSSSSCIAPLSLPERSLSLSLFLYNCYTAGQVGFCFPLLPDLKLKLRMNCSRILLRYYSTHSTYHINQRITSLKQASGVAKLNEALQLFDEMLQRQPPPSIIQFNQLITVIVNMKQYSTALSLYKQINLMGIPTDHYAMNISINCHCRLNQVSYGFALLATIFKQGHPLDLATYNTLINGLVLTDRVFESVELFKKLLRDKLCEPNQIMFGTVINGLCKVGRTSKALELLSTMLQGFFQSGNPAVARELFNDMQAKGRAPDIFTYRILFHGMCQNSQCSDVLALFRSLGSKELMKDIGLHNILIDGWLLVKGKELFRKMEENSCFPDSFAYNVIVQELLKKNECLEAANFLEEMIDRGFMPDHATFENLLPRIPNVGKDSRLQTIILKLTSVERKDDRMPNLTSGSIS
ncbi:hypothetical protein L1987_24924 [Smallanthus sonchifolius]|uniref:Uncharacterized protein n=1 Tax=Smallanthus sonchifolius TaxID=185202 RepID=A0ACB9IN90_9ASTR|nr:hypothetical protein L1987_24924 [Smallanthus sonchifolius]